MVTTIQISEQLQEKLKEKKIYERESYEEVIWDLLEDVVEISEATKRDLRKSEQDIREGRTHTLEKVRKELGI